MTVSGIIIRTDGPEELARIQAALAAEPRCQPGPCEGGAQAAVLEFGSMDEAEELHAWLHALPGVRCVDVVRMDTTDGAPDGHSKVCEAGI